MDKTGKFYSASVMYPMIKPNRYGKAEKINNDIIHAYLRVKDIILSLLHELNR